MKKITILFSLIFAIAGIHAQNYQISFAGTGASTTVDQVKVENLTQCTSLTLSGNDILHLVATIGINELNSHGDNMIHIYPNPITQKCSFDFEAKAQGKTTLTLYDISGKRILQVQELLAKGYHTYNLTGIGSGIYTLKVESDQYSYHAKIVSNNISKGNAKIKHIETSPGIYMQSKSSNTDRMMSMRSDKSLVDMQYNIGDRLKLTGKSGNYRTVFMLVPIQTQTVTFNFVACTDIDNNHYAVVQIGLQIWMAENLNTSNYRNNVPIPNITNNNTWNSLSTGACCNYDNTLGNSTIYGKLYNFYAVEDSRKICPVGWHVPTDFEWDILVTILGGGLLAGGKLKETCTTLWEIQNVGATNETGFSALPGGYREYDGHFSSKGLWAYFWSAFNHLYRYMRWESSSIGKTSSAPQIGMSVRCLKD